MPASTYPSQLRSFLPILLGVLLGLTGCVSPTERVEVDPDRARHAIVALMPAKVADAQGWGDDIFGAFDALEIKPTAQNICAVLAVTEQESTFHVDPVVSGLPAMARREIDSRAARFGIPKVLVSRALALPSPNGQRYSERLGKVKTERELSLIFEDFIGMVPLGKRLFGSLNPVRTGGPMQVSIAFAQEHADDHRYPYADSPNVRHEVFTRRGGMYFGIAHLLDYPVSYDRMLYRFADFNAGHYASRNAAFQNAVTIVTKTKLALDGDLIWYDGGDEPGKTEQAVRSLAGRLGMTDDEIHRDLERGKDDAFEKTKLYRRLFELADEVQGSAAPRAIVPRIRLESVKITRELTTDWFAQRVDQRYRRCLARGSAAPTFLRPPTPSPSSANPPASLFPSSSAAVPA